MMATAMADLLTELIKDETCLGSGLLGGILLDPIKSFANLKLGQVLASLGRLFNPDGARLENPDLHRALIRAQSRAVIAVCHGVLLERGAAASPAANIKDKLSFLSPVLAVKQSHDAELNLLWKLRARCQSTYDWAATATQEELEQHNVTLPSATPALASPRDEAADWMRKEATRTMLDVLKRSAPDPLPTDFIQAHSDQWFDYFRLGLREEIKENPKAATAYQLNFLDHLAVEAGQTREQLKQVLDQQSATDQKIEQMRRTLDRLSSHVQSLSKALEEKDLAPIQQDHTQWQRLQDELKPHWQEVAARLKALEKKAAAIHRDTQTLLAGQAAQTLTLTEIKDSLHARPVSRVRQLPAPPHLFGRSIEVDDLVTRLQSGSTALSISGLQGMGGVGKTALALVIADRVKHLYPGAQIMKNLRGVHAEGLPPATPVAIMQEIIRDFHPACGQLPDQVEQLRPIYLSVLTEAGRVLLILDNAAGPDQVQPLLPPSGCLLLVTSRQHFSLPGMITRDITCLLPADSQAMLLSLAPRLEDHAPRAAELCGHLPLKLEVFGAAVRDRTLYPVPTLLERLQAGKDGLNPEDAAFQLSYDLLPPIQQQAFRALGVFSASFDLRAAGTVLGLFVEQNPWEEDQALPVLQCLVDASLVELNAATGRLRLHDLLRSFALSQLQPEEENQARLAHATHYAQIGGEADDLYMQGQQIQGLALFDQERVHLETAFTWLTRQQPPQEVMDQTLYALVKGIAYTTNLRFHPRQHILWLEAQRDAAIHLNDQRGEGNALVNIGNAHATLGNSLKAIEFYDQALVIIRERGDRQGEGTILGNLGNVHDDLGYPRKALEFYDRALIIARETGDRRGEGQTLNNLGNAHAALGDPHKAIEFYEQALVITSETGDQRGEGATLLNLGNSHSSLGNARKALEFYEQALVIAHETGDRRVEGTALLNLGTAHAALGDAREALGFYEQALVIARETGNRRGEGQILNNLGLAHADLGDVREAFEFYEQALVIARETHDQRGEGSALGNLGRAHAALGDARKAIEFYEQQLVITRETDDSPSEGTALVNLGNAHSALGDAPNALEFYEQALVITRKTGNRRGESHALGNLGNAHADLGDAHKAIEFYEQSLFITRETRDRRGEGYALGNLGLAHANLGNHRKALEFYEQCLVITRETGDRGGEGTALWNAALAYNSLDNRHEAIPRAEAALAIYEAIESPHADWVRQTLAEWKGEASESA